MKLQLTAIVMILAPILVNCADKVDSSTVKGTGSADGLATIGRGSKLVMLKDLEIPANKSQVEIGPIISNSHVEGEGNIYRNSYSICGFQLAETSLDRRVLNSGTVIEFSGETSSHPNEENSKINVHEIKISAPSALTSLGCVKLVRKCFENLCDSYYQTPFKIQDLENVLKDVARIERATPVPIPSNLH